MTTFTTGSHIIYYTSDHVKHLYTFTTLQWQYLTYRFLQTNGLYMPLLFSHIFTSFHYNYSLNLHVHLRCSLHWRQGQGPGARFGAYEAHSLESIEHRWVDWGCHAVSQLSPVAAEAARAEFRTRLGATRGGTQKTSVKRWEPSRCSHASSSDFFSSEMMRHGHVQIVDVWRRKNE